jgi:Ser/Thr protein kinase RdoA (MazF antagonist)
MREPEPDEAAALHAETREALSAWRIAPDHWRLAGAAPGARGGLLRPVVETGSGVWMLRRQAPDLTLDDTRFRHAFMAHLTQTGLPVPALLPTPDGPTWAIVRDSVYELQAYLPGEPFSSDDSAARIESAASLLGALHQASAEFSWAPYAWPDDRSAPALAEAYTRLIRQAAGRDWAGSSVATGLARVADACDDRIAAAAHALALTPAPPELHIHGDFQAHNLAFAGPKVSALYDFDAARWEQRVYELAYALLFFTGLRWTEGEPLTPPRVDDGLDTLLVHRLLAAYGREAPPSEDEAPLLADAMALVFPIAFANGVAEDLVFAEDFADVPDQEDALARLAWADRFWLWLDRYRPTLAEAWENS